MFKRWILFLTPCVTAIFFLCSCSMFSSQGGAAEYPKPDMVKHEEWQDTPPAGYSATGKRLNIAPGESISFRDMKLELNEMIESKGEDKDDDSIRITLSKNGESEEMKIKEGAAFNWEDYHIAVLAVHTGKELGAGLTEFEITTIDSIPEKIAKSKIAGDAAFRARIPHKIEMITLHHSGSPEPMTMKDDPVRKLRGLQKWGMRAKNWWDVPYHFLISPDGTIYEGRDYHYMGETNTKYNPSGHLLISVMGNYELQEPTPEQLEAITGLMAWGVSKFDVPTSKIYGHKDLAQTACPGKHLYKYLDDGTFIQGVKERLKMK